MRRPSAWETIDHTDIIDDFPTLSEEDIGDIMFGKQCSMKACTSISAFLSGAFQLKRAPSYAAEKAGTNDLSATVTYSIQRCRPFPNLIRTPTQSAYSQRRSYYPTIQLSSDEILGRWCDCPIGS